MLRLLQPRRAAAISGFKRMLLMSAAARGLALRSTPVRESVGLNPKWQEFGLNI
jgi:hypothetical protein